jgi:predicted transcriptional regulator
MISTQTHAKVHLNFIKHIKLRELLPNTECRTDIIQIDSQSTLEEASIILAKNSLLSAPVWDQLTSRYIGLLDLLDLVGFIVFSPILDEKHQKEEETYFK